MPQFCVFLLQASFCSYHTYLSYHPRFCQIFFRLFLIFIINVFKYVVKIEHIRKHNLLYVYILSFLLVITDDLYCLTCSDLFLLFFRIFIVGNFFLRIDAYKYLSTWRNTLLVLFASHLIDQRIDCFKFILHIQPQGIALSNCSLFYLRENRRTACLRSP